MKESNKFKEKVDLAEMAYRKASEVMVAAKRGMLDKLMAKDENYAELQQLMI